jgi:hypothetical protein
VAAFGSGQFCPKTAYTAPKYEKVALFSYLKVFRNKIASFPLLGQKEMVQSKAGILLYSKSHSFYR